MKTLNRQCQQTRPSVFPKTPSDLTTSTRSVASGHPPKMVHPATTTPSIPFVLSPRSGHNTYKHEANPVNITTTNENPATTPNPLKTLHGTCAAPPKLKWCRSPLQSIHLRITQRFTIPKAKFEIEVRNKSQDSRLIHRIGRKHTIVAISKT